MPALRGRPPTRPREPASAVHHPSGSSGSGARCTVPALVEPARIRPGGRRRGLERWWYCEARQTSFPFTAPGPSRRSIPYGMGIMPVFGSHASAATLPRYGNPAGLPEYVLSFTQHTGLRMMQDDDATSDAWLRLVPTRRNTLPLCAPGTVVLCATQLVVALPGS